MGTAQKSTGHPGREWAFDQREREGREGTGGGEEEEGEEEGKHEKMCLGFLALD